MATICDFRECQKVLDQHAIRTLTINSKRYVTCEKCYDSFNEYLEMYLFEPTVLVAQEQLMIPAQMNNRVVVQQAIRAVEEGMRTLPHATLTANYSFGGSTAGTHNGYVRSNIVMSNTDNVSGIYRLHRREV